MFCTYLFYVDIPFDARCRRDKNSLNPFVVLLSAQLETSGITKLQTSKICKNLVKTRKQCAEIKTFASD